MKSVPTQNEQTNSDSAAGRSVLVSWFPQWMGWYSSSTAAATTETTSLEGEILQALSDSVEDNTVLRRDVVFGQFTFTLKNGLLNLCTVNEDSKERYVVVSLMTAIYASS